MIADRTAEQRGHSKERRSAAFYNPLCHASAGLYWRGPTDRTGLARK